MEKLLKKYKYVIIIILAGVIVAISATHYSSIKKVIVEKYDSRQQLVEKNILQTVNYVDDSYKIVEQQLNREMKEYSQIMIEKYRNNPEVMEWDLEELKQEFGNYEIYIIDSDLKIIKTTEAQDLGLDFSRYSSFAKVLRDRLEGDSFAVDRIDLATQTGEVNKYSYMPTPDNKYLLELSVDIQARFPSMASLDMFGDATDLTEDYEIVEEISFFSIEPINHQVAKLRSTVKPYLDPDVSEIEDELASQAVVTEKVQTKVVATDTNEYTYRFFPAIVAKGREGEGWNSYVVGITYNDRVIQEEINKHRNLFFVNILIMIIVFLSFILIVVYLLRKFEHLAYHDQLTGLGDRKLLEEKFVNIKKEADKSGSKAGILFIDINKFKEINDNYGHDTGDAVLEKIASRLKNKLKKKDILARLGGDEFVIALADIDSEEEAVKIAHRVIDGLKEPLLINGEKFHISVSGGISIYPEEGSQLEELIKNADEAMYQAKQKNKDLVFNF